MHIPKGIVMDIQHLRNIAKAIKSVSYPEALADILILLNKSISRNDENEDHIPLIRMIVEFVNSHPEYKNPALRKALSVFSKTLPLKSN